MKSVLMVDCLCLRYVHSLNPHGASDGLPALRQPGRGSAGASLLAAAFGHALRRQSFAPEKLSAPAVRVLR